MKKVLDFFGSMRVGLILLGIIGGTAALAALFSLDGFYHTRLFGALLVLLFLNMLFCTFRRCRGIFSRQGGWEKWNRRSLGIFLLHAGLLCIMVGGAVYSYWGRETPVTLAEGETVRMRRLTGREKAFDLHLNDFRIDLYPDGSPSQFVSNVTIRDGSRKVGTFDIAVNHPLRYGGVTMYQERYGWAVRVAFAGGEQRLVKEGEFCDIPTTGYRVLFYRYIPNYDPMYGMESKNLKPANPRVVFAVYEGDRRLGVGMVRLGEKVAVTEGVGFRFAETVPLTTLKVKSDPGITFVWTGFGLLLGGIFLALYRAYLPGAEPKKDETVKGEV